MFLLFLTRRCVLFVRAGMVPEPASQVAEDREVLGKKHDNGRVRSVRRHGQTLAAAAGDHSEERQGERVRRALVAR